MKSTKKSLLASGLALLVCCSLLIGTTFAWFTDNVTNKDNKSQAGTLNVSLAEWDGAAGGYVEVGEEPIFNYDLWEPGYTDIAAVKIGNEGTLALKYQLDIIAHGASDLAEVIDVYYYQNGNAAEGLPESFAAIQEDAENYVRLGTLSELMEQAKAGGMANGHLEAGEADFAIIALHMQEDAGNEYQATSIGSTFDIVLNATQYTSESEKDAFGSKDYDKDAKYPVITTVSDIDSLKEALQNPGVPVDVTLDNHLSGVRNALDVTGDVTLNMGANSIYSVTPTSAADAIVTDGGSLTVNAEAMSGLNYNLGQLTADGDGSILTVNGGKYGESGSGKPQTTATNGGTVVINDGSFNSSGYQGHAVTATNGGTVIINGGSVGSSGAESIVLYADGGTIVVENVTFAYINGQAYGAVNGGQILVSKEFSPSQPTRVAANCTITGNGDYWLIQEA